MAALEGQMMLPTDFNEFLLPVHEYQEKVEHPEAWVAEMSDPIIETISRMFESRRSFCFVVDYRRRPVAAFSPK
eukprot:g3375.t1